MLKVLITDDVHDHLLRGLQNLGYHCDYQPKISLKDAMDVIHLYHGVVINSKIIADAAFLDKAEKLVFLARLGSGLDIIDLKAAASNNIEILSAPEGNCNAVAEHALGTLLALINNICKANAQVKTFSWKRESNRGAELDGKTVGIIGFGHTGQALAKKLSGFDIQCLAYDLFHPGFGPRFSNVSEVTLQEIQARADVISLHVSLNETSIHLVNRSFIEACSNPFILVNTSRGKAVCLPDLVWGLESGRVTGACLDVFENEKPATFSDEEKALYSRLYNCENAILTPHVAGWTKESKWKIADVLFRKIQALEKKPSIGHK